MLKDIKIAYEKCLRLRWKQRKTIPYKELDKVLFVVERYIRWMEETEEDLT